MFNRNVGAPAQLLVVITQPITKRLFIIARISCLIYEAQCENLVEFTPNRLEDNYPEGGGSALSETWVTICQIKRRHMAEDTTVH